MQQEFRKNLPNVVAKFSKNVYVRWRTYCHEFMSSRKHVNVLNTYRFIAHRLLEAVLARRSIRPITRISTHQQRRIIIGLILTPVNFSILVLATDN